LVTKIEALRPHFGRAQGDIEAIIVRARNKDYRGVLQNTRLVVETLFRALMSKDKSQQVGKQTLEQLLTKLNNELPTQVAVHARTIQAWGNVGAHDHATDLFAAGVEVKPEEAVAALNALVPILEWYKKEHIAAGDRLSGGSQPAAPVIPISQAAPAVFVAEKKSPMGKIVAVGIVVTVVGLGALVMTTQAERAGSTTSARAAVDAYYTNTKEPVPPQKCKAVEAGEIAALADATVWLTGGKPHSKRPEDLQAHDRLEKAKLKSGEGNAFLARARLYAGLSGAAVLDAAERSLALCETPMALATLGSAHLLNDDSGEAKKAYDRALALAPEYGAAKINLALVEMKAGEPAAAIALLEQVVAKEPQHPAASQALATAYLLHGQSLEKSGDAEGAKKAFCRAKELGETKAVELCP
jgi:tetratricopeptide (TPR) repeat protein